MTKNSTDIWYCPACFLNFSFVSGEWRSVSCDENHQHTIECTDLVIQDATNVMQYAATPREKITLNQRFAFRLNEMKKLHQQRIVLQRTIESTKKILAKDEAELKALDELLSSMHQQLNILLQTTEPVETANRPVHWLWTKYTSFKEILTR